MDVVASSWQERSEVDVVLRSGIFEKAPRLENFFVYICRLHFEGRADEIKEYSIALEALGRCSDFDPKKDSIVRVEAHRLRKRLEEYYQGAGVNDDVHIIIPNGQYRPQFVLRHRDPSKPRGEHTGPLGPTSLIAISEPDPPVAIQLAVLTGMPQGSPSPAWKRFRPWLVGLVSLIAAFGAIHYWLGASHKARPMARIENEKWLGPSADPVPEEFRILSGYHGPPFVDGQGHTWGADAYFTGGLSEAIPTGHFIEGQPDPHLLKTHRSGQFQYDIPLRQGSHELHLYFAETDYGQGNPLGGGEASRIFGVSVNGVPTLTTFDPLADAGSPNRLHQRVLKDIVPAADGKLHIRFDPGTAPAFLNAIEILHSLPGRIHPVRIVMQNSPVTDSDGHLWAADEYFCGGVQAFRRNIVANPREKAIYQGERYGNFSYHIPLAAGEYRLTLHFAETWFGTPESRQPALDSRIFNVFANGVSLLRDYQIVKDAGGPNRSVERVFDRLVPNAQGELLLEFIPVRNYAELNAIEVVESR
jgi:hypothetical protein